MAKTKLIWALVGMALYALGTQVFTFALPWYVMSRTGSLTLMGTLWAVQTLMIGLTSFGVGQWVDSRPARQMGMVGLSCQFVAVSATMYVLADHYPSVSGLVGCMALLALGSNLFGLTAEFKIIPAIARPDSELAWANGIYGSLWSGSAVAGPALGGVFVALLNFGGAFGFVLFSLLISFSVVSMLSPSRNRKQERAQVNATTGNPVLPRGIKMGIVFLGLAAAVGNVGTGNLGTVTTFYLGHSLRLASSVVGLFFGAGALLQIIASALSPLLYNTIGPIKTRLVYTVIPAAALLSLAAVGHVWAGLGFAFAEAAMAGFNMVSRTIRQQTIPHAFSGRTAGFYRTIAVSPAALSAVFLVVVDRRIGYAGVLGAGALSLAVNGALAIHGIKLLTKSKKHSATLVGSPSAAMSSEK